MDFFFLSWGTLSHSFDSFVFLTLFIQDFIWTLEIIEMSWIKFTLTHLIQTFSAGSIFRT